MFKLKAKKLTALILSSFMSITVLGTTLAEAHPNDNPPPRQEEPRHPKHNEDGHSTGEVTTAAIAGAVVGAVIAKNT
ncbi:hypothetical protein [Pectinatus haikarae]|uniref:Uncharacterized protein n=2 Tax=Pectinatus haikarae TaxID=349096 RepID=A0ABT9YCL5_9FIRM|nr:hypothetical protein [Pectinatus haikarae]MDQ0204942.1 hypothetical protein [Pectinatus haikarae]